MIHSVLMSCGHREELDLATTGKHLSVDIQYFAQQGLCAKCWAELRERKAKQRTMHRTK